MVVWWVFVVSAILFGVRQLQKLWQGQTINLPKYLLLIAQFRCIGLFLTSPITPAWRSACSDDLAQRAVPSLIWFHNKNKYQPKNDGVSKSYGLASIISKHFLFYAAFGLLFNLIYHVPRGYVSLRVGATGILAGFFWGFAFIHYYLDSKIWRVRRDAVLSKSLNMTPS